MPNPRTLEDVIWLLASYLVDQNSDKLDDIVKAISGVSERLDQHAHKLEQQMSDINDQNQARIDALADRLTEQFAEVKAAIDDLRNQPGAREMNFDRVDAAVQDVADTIPDVPPVEP